MLPVGKREKIFQKRCSFDSSQVLYFLGSVVNNLVYVYLPIHVCLNALDR